tara:strand:- start:422 stop:736 length:315 start_codon:yes stop_codon:yes gene_type:complete
MKKIFVDIDETICFYAGDRDYNLALPIKERIEKINSLYDAGNEITYWTARGTVTEIDWYSVTYNQLEKWGCKWHHLCVGKKPAYDLLICDKAINSEQFFNKESK